MESGDLTVDYHALNEVTEPLSAAVLDVLELQYELESKVTKWYATIEIASVFFSIPLATECRPQFAFAWRGVQTPGIDRPMGGNTAPPFAMDSSRLHWNRVKLRNTSSRLTTSSCGATQQKKLLRKGRK